MNKKTFGDKVKERISTNITIPIIFPKPVYLKFKQFAKEEACNTYWNAIEKLITYYDENNGKNAFGLMLLDKIMQLEEEIDSMKEEEKPKSRTKKQGFGRKE